MELDEKALQACMDAEIDRLYRGSGPKLNRKERAAFKRDNREEFVCTINAYLTALVKN